MNKGDELFVDIAGIAKQQTQRKDPGTQHNDTATNGHAQPNGNVSSNGNQFYTPPVKEEKTESKKEEPAAAAAAEQVPADQPISKDEEKAIEASGKTGAFLAAGLIEMIFGLTETVVHINRFSSSEKQRLLEIDDKEPHELTEADQSLNLKFAKMLKKHEAIKKKIECNPKEMEALEKAFAEYRRITGKDLNPNLILYSTISRIFISRGMEIFL